MKPLDFVEFDQPGGRFDRLARFVARGATRRATFGLAIATGLSALFTGEAKKRKKKKCKKCSVCQKCKKGKCKPKPNGTACGENRTCGSSQCLCAPGFFPCDSGCCPSCDSGSIVQGVCIAACPAGASLQGPCDQGQGLCCACDVGRVVCNDTCVFACESGQRFNDACECVAG